jgi:DNA-binding CsgD family transcriptional regulator/PAS domain-containing protein
MAQYLIFLALAPLALAGSLSALLLPRIVHSYQRFAWLRIYNYLQLVFLAINTIELLVQDPGLKQAMAATDYLLIGSGPAIWLLFSLEYTGLSRGFRPWQAALFAVPALVCAAAFLNGPNGLVWRGLAFERSAWILEMHVRRYGIAAIAFFAYDYALLVVGFVILFRHTVLTHQLYRRQTAWLIAGILLPLAVHFAFISKRVPGWNKDFSSIAGALGGFCFSFGCLRHRLFAVVPVSRQALLQQMKVGMIVVDQGGTVIDLNQTACSMLGISEINYLGESSVPLLAAIESHGLELSRQPVRDPSGGISAWHLELREKGNPAEAVKAEASNSVPVESPILTLGELRVIEMLALNLSNKEISSRLGISVNTVKFHLNNAYRKTGAKNRAELIHRIGAAIAGTRD